MTRYAENTSVSVSFNPHDERVRNIGGLPRYLNTDADIRAAYAAAFGGRDGE